MAKTPKYKYGDKVIVRPDLNIDTIYGGAAVIDSMVEKRGETVEISLCFEHEIGYLYFINDSTCCWTEEMFSGYAKECTAERKLRTVSEEERKNLDENTDKFFEILGEISDE